MTDFANINEADRKLTKNELSPVPNENKTTDVIPATEMFSTRTDRTNTAVAGTATNVSESFHPTAKEMNTTTISNERNDTINTGILMKEVVHEMHSSLMDYSIAHKNILTENLQKCKAMMFLSLVKGGTGNGILLTRNTHKHSWNSPCAISIKYKSNAIDFPLEKINYLLLINNNENNNKKIMCLPSNEYLLLGIDIQFLFQTNFQNEELRGEESLLYLLSKEGAEVTQVLIGAVIAIDKLSNQQYYQKNVEETDILNGNVKLTYENEWCSLSQLLNNLSGGKSTNDNIQKPYQWNSKAPLYRYYVINEKEFTTYQQILELPVLPFLNDIKKKNKNPKFADIGKKIYHSFKNLLHSSKNKTQKNVNDVQNTDNNKLIRKSYFDENAPLYQYYCNNIFMYDYKQLQALTKFPFLDDIASQRYSLQKYNPINAIKSYYKSYIQTNRRANAIYNYYHNRDENKNNKQSAMKRYWRFDENIPMYQYYVVHNQNGQQLANTIQYNKTFLSKLPVFPFLKDIKIRKYSLFKYNPISFSKRIYHQISSKFNSSNVKNSQHHAQPHQHQHQNDDNINRGNDNVNFDNNNNMNKNITNVDNNKTNVNTMSNVDDTMTTPNYNMTNVNTMTNANTMPNVDDNMANLNTMSDIDNNIIITSNTITSNTITSINDNDDYKRNDNNITNIPIDK